MNNARVNSERPHSCNGYWVYNCDGTRHNLPDSAQAIDWRARSKDVTHLSYEFRRFGGLRVSLPNDWLWKLSLIVIFGVLAYFLVTRP